MRSVRLERLTKQFGETKAVSWVDLEVAAGEFFTLLGPSGCGKTTLLRLLAGLERPDEGAIYFGAERVDGEPAHRRNIGMLFPRYLFPHLTVAQNVAYGLKARRFPSAEVAGRVAEALALVQMNGYEERRPEQLSGGQQQRVALARALAPRPAVLLMDEPLAHLDAGLRVSMREEIRRVQRRVGITTIYVTHDPEEAFALSDRIAVMDAGLLRQVGRPEEVYRHPANRAVAVLVGGCGMVSASCDGRDITVGEHMFYRNFANEFSGPVWLGLRPEMVRLQPPGWRSMQEIVLEGAVEEELFLGASLRVRVRLTTGERLESVSPDPTGTYRTGTKVSVAFLPQAPFCFDGQSGAVIP